MREEFIEGEEYMGSTVVGDFFKKLSAGNYGVQTPKGGISINKNDTNTVPIPVTIPNTSTGLPETIKKNMPYIAGGIGILVLLMVLKK